MNKTEYFKYIKQQIKDLLIEEQLKIIRKEKNNVKNMQKWLNEVEEQALKKYAYCSKCEKHSKTNEFKQIEVKETQYECTYSDCGYGDSDTFGNVEYLITYSICPLCGNKKQTNKMYLRTLNEFDRWGNKC